MSKVCSLREISAHALFKGLPLTLSERRALSTKLAADVKAEEWKEQLCKTLPKNVTDKIQVNTYSCTRGRNRGNITVAFYSIFTGNEGDSKTLKITTRDEGWGEESEILKVEVEYEDDTYLYDQEFEWFERHQEGRYHARSGGIRSIFERLAADLGIGQGKSSIADDVCKDYLRQTVSELQRKTKRIWEVKGICDEGCHGLDPVDHWHPCACSYDLSCSTSPAFHRRVTGGEEEQNLVALLFAFLTRDVLWTSKDLLLHILSDLYAEDEDSS